jgi:MFS-type transporter involved in bile tolerance (Atg22 family)
MGRVYAGILGPLAMAVIIGRGVLGSSGVEGTLTTATIYLLLFAALGAILGQVAEATIDESVRAQLQKQLSHQTANARE